MNDTNKKIIREEFARAMMIKKMKSLLSESAFRGFMRELTKFENNKVLTEGIKSENRYDAFFKGLLEVEATAERPKPPEEETSTKPKDATGTKTASATADPDEPRRNQNNTDASKKEKQSNVGAGKGFPNTLSGNGKIELERRQLTNEDPVKIAKYILNNKDAFDTGDQIEAEQFLKFKRSELGDAPEEPTGNVKQDAQNLNKELESPKAKGILASIFDSYKFAFASNAKMWEKIYDFINGLGSKSPAEQEKGMKDAKTQIDNSVDTDKEAGRTGKEDLKVNDTEVGDKKQLSVRSIQRPIINLVMRTASAQGVDVNVKQAEDIAIAITKNLVNQMRANGVEFKGLTKDLKESYMSELNKILKEERFTRPNQLEKMATMSKTGTKQTGVKIGSQWIETAKQLKDKIVPFKMHKKEGFAQSLEEASKEENSMIDFLDLANDLTEMLKTDVVQAARSGARRKREIFDNLKDILMATLKQYRKNNIVIVKSVKNNKGGEIIEKISLTPEYRRKYIELKKKVKGLDKGEDKKQSSNSDVSTAPATKGKVNISQTVAKAIQAGGLDKDVAKKITPILKKKIEDIIGKHLDADVKMLEEKINRYVNSVIKEIK